jgi:hypothetical protein
MHHIKNFVPQPKILNMHDAMASSTMHSKNFKSSMYYPFAILIILYSPIKKTKKKYCQRLKSWQSNNKLSYTKKIENA